jgi:hypothetical protein
MKSGMRVFGTMLWLGALSVAAAITLGLAADRVGEHRSSTFGRAYEDFERSWGGEIGVPPMQFSVERSYTEEVFDKEAGQFKKVERKERIPQPPHSLSITSRVDYAEQKRGWLKFNAFEATCEENYRVVNRSRYSGALLARVSKPAHASLMHGYTVRVAGQEAQTLLPSSEPLLLVDSLAPGAAVEVSARYAVKGMDVFKHDLSDYRDSVVRNLDATLVVNTNRFEIFRFGLPHTRGAVGSGARLEFHVRDFATTQDLGITFLARNWFLDQVHSLLNYSPLAPFLFLLAIFVMAQVRAVRFHSLHYLFFAIIHVFYFLFVAYLVRFLGVVTTFALSAALTGGMFFAYVPSVLGWRFGLRVAGICLLLLTVVFSAIFLLPVFRGLLFLSLVFLILMILMISVGRSDVSRWPILAAGNPDTGRGAAG